MAFNINNRRYTGSKYKIVPSIKKLVEEECLETSSFFDVFAGTGVVTAGMINNFTTFYLNDFLYSNELIYKAFFEKKNYDLGKLVKISEKFRNLDSKNLTENYVSSNYGNKFFEYQDSLKIGYIREEIEKIKSRLNEREYSILLCSLLYSLDRCANTVGHYDAYIKNSHLKSNFTYELINPIITSKNDPREIKIFREDANELVKRIKADVVYIDPPYSSRQYSRFYHVFENIVKWEKPILHGVAMKPESENMSVYCCSKAIDAFRELISNLKCKYIIVSYNNTYNSKSSSSKNKMSLEDIKATLESRGLTNCIAISHSAFNAGKTDLEDHKELLFLTKVGA